MVDNTVTIVGTITMDPELRTTNSGMEEESQDILNRMKFWRDRFEK